MSKTYILSLFILVCLPSMVRSQVKSIDVDTHSFSFEYIKAPSKPFYYERDTNHKYSVRGIYEPSFNSFISAQTAENAITINGWQNVPENERPSILVTFRGSDLKSKVEILDNVEKKKDKNGKDIIIHLYKARMLFGFGKTSFNVVDCVTNKQIYQSLEISSKDVVYEYQSSSYSKRRDAERDIDNNIDAQRLNALSIWNDKIVQIVSDNICSIIGWPFAWQKTSLKVTDEKKWNENQTNKEYYMNTRNIIESIESCQDLVFLEDDFQPAIKYYLSLLDNYTNANDTKIDARIRSVALYNLTSIYFCLEKFDIAEQYANKYILNGYKPNDINSILKSINKVKEYFIKNRVSTLHPDIPYVMSGVIKETTNE